MINKIRHSLIGFVIYIFQLNSLFGIEPPNHVHVEETHTPSHSTRIRLSLPCTLLTQDNFDNITRFINQTSPTLPHKNKEDSLKASYLFLENMQKKEATLSGVSVSRLLTYKALLGQARLTTEQEYSPIDTPLKEHLESLIGRLKDVSTEYWTLQKQERDKLSHYTNIYLGKLHVFLDQHTEAWTFFSHLKPRYTKSYYIDMAELILTYKYTPPTKPSNFTNKEYALSLLKNLKSVKSLSTTPRTRSQINKTRPLNHENQIAHPGYVGQHYIKEKIQYLHDQTIDDAAASPRSNQRIPQPPPASVSSSLKQRKRSGEFSHHSTAKRRRLSTADASPESLTILPPQNSPLLDHNIYESSIEENSEDLLSLSQDEEEEPHEILIIPPINLHQDYTLHYCTGYNLKDQEALPYFLNLLKKVQADHFKNLEIKCLMKLGQNPFNPENIDHLKQALILLKEKGPWHLKVQCYLALGKIHRNTDRIPYLYKALNLLRGKNDWLLEAKTYLNLGKIPGNHQLEDLEKTLKILESRNNWKLETETYLNLGKIMNNPHKISDLYKALALLENRGRWKLEAEAYLALGKIPSNPNQADDLNAALQRLHKKGEWKLEAEAYLALGKVISNENRLNDLNKALKLIPNKDEWLLETEIYLALGKIIVNKNRIAHLNKALRLLHQRNEWKLEAEAYLALGKILVNKNRIHDLKKALEASHNVDDWKLTAEIYLTLGGIPGNHQFDDLITAQNLVLGKNEYKLEAKIYLALGKTRSNKNRRFHLTKALDILQNKGEWQLEVDIYLALGRIPHSHQDTHLKAALKILERRNEWKLESKVYIALGKIPRNNQVHYLSRALALVQDKDDRQLLVEIYLALGKVPHYNQEKYLQKVLELAQENEWILKTNAYLSFAHLYSAQENFKKAIQACDKGLEIIQQHHYCHKEELYYKLKKIKARCQHFLRRR